MLRYPPGKAGAGRWSGHWTERKCLTDRGRPQSECRAQAGQLKGFGCQGERRASQRQEVFVGVWGFRQPKGLAASGKREARGAEG